MKKIHIICIIIIALLLFCLIEYLIMKPPTIKSTIEISNPHAENNYENNFPFDCDGDYIAYKYDQFGTPVLRVWHKNKKVLTVSHVRDFRIQGEVLYYTDENSILNMHNLNTGLNQAIAKDVTAFTLYQKDVIYLSDSAQKRACIIRLNLITQKEKKIADNVAKFFLNEDTLYITDFLHKNVREISLNTNAVSTISCKIPLMSTYEFFQMCNNQIIIIDDGILHILDVKTGSEQQLQVAPEDFGGANIHEFVCNDQYIIVSLQKIRIGLFENEVKETHDMNGLWLIDPITLEKKKVSNQTYDHLYLSDNTLLGTIGNSLYMINTQTFESTKIIG